MKQLKSVYTFAAICALLAPMHALSQQWGMLGGNPQHTAESVNGVQTMNAVLWQTPVDTSPPDGLGIHYGCPLVSAAGTVVVSVRDGGGNGLQTANDTYHLEGHNIGTGALIYTQTTDFVDWMPHIWTPSYSPAIDSNDALYYAGNGGTIWKRASANSASSTTTQLCFYGMTNYTANESAYNGAVQIDTPITIDSSNNIYFGFYVDSGFYSNGNNVPGLKNGIAKISPSGAGTWIAVDAVTGNTGDEAQVNGAPAISNDGTHLYFGSKQTGDSNSSFPDPMLNELNTSDLSVAHTVALTIPAGNPIDPSALAFVWDVSSGCPMVGPDGDVFFGVWYKNIARGFMLHYSSDLSTQKTAGAFGWDDTASVVPASAVPGYSGTSTYLICTKYNNYADDGAWGDGENKVALLDPNDFTETFTIQYGPFNPGPDFTNPSWVEENIAPGDPAAGVASGASYTTMSEIKTLLGITSNSETYNDGLSFDQGDVFPGVREWCVNSVVIDVPGKAAIVNSEDGHTYRWDFTTNAITDNVNLEPPTSEAYTPTVASGDGVAFSINNATLFAMWDNVKPLSISSSVGNNIVGSGNSVGTINLTGNATGPGAYIYLTSSNASLTVPSSPVHVLAGHNTATFAINTTTVSGDTPVTITATRYGFPATLNVTVKEAVLASFSLSPSSVVGGNSTLATIHLASGAGASGDLVLLTGTGPAVLPSPGESVSGTARTFSIATNGVASPTTENITARLGTSTFTVPLTVNVARLNTVTFSPSTVIGGPLFGNTTLKISLNGNAPQFAGYSVSLSPLAGPAILPGTATVPMNSPSTSFTVGTHSVSTTVVESVVAWPVIPGGIPVIGTITVTPLLIRGWVFNRPTLFMTDGLSGTITLNQNLPSQTTLSVSDSNGRLVIDTQPVVSAGSHTATFTAHAVQLPIGNRLPYLSNLTLNVQGATLSQGFVVTPFGLSSLTLSSTTIHAGQSTNLTIRTEEPAGVIPIVCNLASGNSALLPAPPTGVIPAGSASGVVRLTAAATIGQKTVVPIRVTLSTNSVLLINVTVEP